jgi:hypothetical protein
MKGLKDKVVMSEILHSAWDYVTGSDGEETR